MAKASYVYVWNFHIMMWNWNYNVLFSMGCPKSSVFVKVKNTMKTFSQQFNFGLISKWYIVHQKEPLNNIFRSIQISKLCIFDTPLYENPQNQVKMAVLLNDAGHLFRENQFHGIFHRQGSEGTPNSQKLLILASKLV